MSARLRGRVALVTGAAGGLGSAFAARLAREGADTVLVDVRPCHEHAAQLADLGVSTHAACVDISDERAVEALATQIDERFGRLDVLVNNAGFSRLERFDEITLASWRELMAVNLEGPFLMTRAFAAGMRARGWGRIVNIASNTFGMGLPVGFAHYIASKGGLIGLTRALASEFGGEGVTVNAISPGLTETPSTRVKMREQFARDLAKQAIPRTGQPEDLVGTLAFLASDDAGFVTGQTFNVDGGLVRA